MANTVGGRLYTLDGMRGLAAICVAVYHCEHTIGYHLIPGGYLAVDFFFALSGLVIGRAYATKLAEGLSPLRFTAMRIVRLFPMYALGLLLGIVALSLGFDIATKQAAEINLSSVVLNAVMLPSLTTSYLFPMNAPSWSLFFELIANVIFGFWLYRVRSAIIGAIALGSFLAFYLLVHKLGSTNLGTAWGDAVGGLARVMWSFNVGLLIARFSTAVDRKVSRVALFVALAPIVYMTMRPIGRTDFFFILLLSPIAIFTLSRIEVTQRLRRFCETLGDISYPLYATHFPLLALVHIASSYLHLSQLAEFITFLLTAVPTSFVLVEVDAAMRRKMSSLLKLRVTAKPQVI